MTGQITQNIQLTKLYKQKPGTMSLYNLTNLHYNYGTKYRELIANCMYDVISFFFYGFFYYNLQFILILEVVFWMNWIENMICVIIFISGLIRGGVLFNWDRSSYILLISATHILLISFVGCQYKFKFFYIVEVDKIWYDVCYFVDQTGSCLIEISAF